MFVKDNNQLNAIDVSQTNTMTEYIKKKNYKQAYAIACLGITTQDFKILGMDAVQNQEFEIAKKCFLKINELELFELILKFEREKELNGSLDPTLLKAEVAAYQ